MASILKSVQLGVEKDLSGGIKVRLGTSMGLLSPEQALEFALVLLKAAGVSMDFGPQFYGKSLLEQLPKQFEHS